MRRRFNYTERKRITRDQIEIKLNRDGDTVESFSAKLNLNGMNLPLADRVYIEAYRRADVERYPFGTVDNIAPPDDTSLSRLRYQESLRFRVLVTDESGERGLIHALAEGIPAEEYRKRSILPVDFRDLGRRIWKIEFGADGPVLLLNEKVPGIYDLGKEPQFRLCVYPAALRDVLTHMVFVENAFSSEELTDNWTDDWIRFARALTTGDGDASVILDVNSPQFDDSEAMQWTDGVVNQFCWSLSREWSHLTKRQEVM